MQFRICTHQSWAQAVGDWVLDQSAMYGPSLPFINQLVVVLPDTRARAGMLSPNSDGYCLEVEARDPSSHEVHYVFSHSNRILGRGCLGVEDGGRVLLPRHDEAARLDVFCVHRVDGVISHKAFEWDTLQSAGPPTASEREDIMREIREGERETVEFKPFLDGRGDKPRELAKTAVAFANTRGGSIYVGVTDHGQLQGWAALNKLKTSNDTNGLNVVMDTVRKIIHDLVKPVPSIACHSVEFPEGPLVVLRIGEGPDVYSTHEDEFYVRKGSTNRRPDLTTELEPLLAARRRVPLSDTGNSERLHDDSDGTVF